MELSRRLERLAITKPRAIIGRIVSRSREPRGSQTASFAPIGRIPPEVLAKIFVHSLPGESSFTEPSIHTPPLLLSLVSTQWRKVAITTPTLWTGLEVYFHNDPDDPPESFIKMWLDRSGPLPVNLYVWCAPNVQVPRPIMKHFLATMHRWKIIDFEFEDTAGQVVRPPSGAPLLEVARIASINAGQWPDVLSTAPRLRRLLTLWSAPRECLMWSRLTDFTAHPSPLFSQSMSACFDILSFCPNLTQCTFLRINWTLPNHNLSALTHSRLQTLIISGESTANLGCFVDHLTLPALTDLIIIGDSMQGDWPQSQWLALLRRSACIIRKLHFVAICALTEPDILEWLSSAQVNSSITELRVKPYLPISFEETLRRLVVSDGYLAPNLESIGFQGSFFDRTPDGAFADMIESRLAHIAPPVNTLKRVHVSLPYRHPNDRRRLTNLQNAGMDIHF